MIEHRLKNTGAKPINASVYDHNFLRLKPGNADIRVTFPFPVTAASPPPGRPDPDRGRDRHLSAPDKKQGAHISFLITGFLGGNSPKDYDFRVEDTASGVRVQGDQPITRLNVFSIDRVQSVEPYVAIDLAPGEEKHWRYTYSFSAS